MEGMEDLSWIFDMEISQIQLQDEMEDQNEIELRGKGKQAMENPDTVPKIQNVASSNEYVGCFCFFVVIIGLCGWRHFRQVNGEESTLMVPTDQNEPVTPSFFFLFRSVGSFQTDFLHKNLDRRSFSILMKLKER